MHNKLILPHVLSIRLQHRWRHYTRIRHVRQCHTLFRPQVGDLTGEVSDAFPCVDSANIRTIPLPCTYVLFLCVPRRRFRRELGKQALISGTETTKKKKTAARRTRRTTSMMIVSCHVCSPLFGKRSAAIPVSDQQIKPGKSSQYRYVSAYRNRHLSFRWRGG